VLATVSDRKTAHSSNSSMIDYYTADVISAQDYYPFGMIMPGRKYSAGNLYRCGFNGKENDNDVKGEGNQQDYGLRIYDPRLVKFLSVDPLTGHYPYYSPYQFAGNNPIAFIDLDGGEPKDPGEYTGQGGSAPTYTKDEKTGKETASKDLYKWIWDKGAWNKTDFGVTKCELKQLFPKGKNSHLQNLETNINLKGAEFGISNYDILSHFLAQAAHETGGFTKEATTEGGLYSAGRVKVVWGEKSYIFQRITEDPTILKDEVRFYNAAYSDANNKWLGNGNEASGDGYAFRGSGYFQLTGKHNYSEFTKFFNKTFGASYSAISANMIGSDNKMAISSAMWFFKVTTLPAIKKGSSFETITKTINAKALGLTERRNFYIDAKKIFN
jgi:RHS repeat-associated protein